MKRTALAITALLLLPALARAQSAPAWDATLRTFDSAYWEAYNRCDIDTLTRMNKDNLEFYHDTGGPLFGNAQFAQAMQQNICRAGVTIRRAEVAGSVHVFPLRANDQLYGAVIEGEHQFYRHSAGQPEQLEGRARSRTWCCCRTASGKWRASSATTMAPLRQAAPTPKRA